MEMVNVRKIKKGEFVKRKADALKTYIRGDYCRIQKKFSLTDVDDHCREIFVKPTADLFVGFTF